MKRLLPLFLILIVLLFSCATKVSGEEPLKANAEEIVVIDEDLTGKLKFNENSETVKSKVTVKSYIDGDTTHKLGVTCGDLIFLYAIFHYARICCVHSHLQIFEHDRGETFFQLFAEFRR